MYGFLEARGPQTTVYCILALGTRRGIRSLSQILGKMQFPETRQFSYYRSIKELFFLRLRRVPPHKWPVSNSSLLFWIKPCTRFTSTRIALKSNMKSNHILCLFAFQITCGIEKSHILCLATTLYIYKYYTKLAIATAHLHAIQCHPISPPVAPRTKNKDNSRALRGLSSRD